MSLVLRILIFIPVAAIGLTFLAGFIWPILFVWAIAAAIVYAVMAYCWMVAGELTKIAMAHTRRRVR